MSQGILYVSYDGMLEPLGRSQVLAYLELTGDDALPARCRHTAVDLFSLGRGVAAYARIYDQMAAS
ncbi:hypothetical protein H9L13_06480 [Sphingomonas lutea]|uniref:Uncharacterized protein n=1 Tax=Sphingomonas lutea TaxID=1045317 RepID=A0A7G9SEV4_9SPHN|nr:hypothetical protein [Sphingomonas lutea]QNN66379.1 hypothetical protein H9L13_06480 [Sphingomonas lutea]